jgi:hypothetical protein
MRSLNRCPSEFGPTGFACQQIIKPNNAPARVFYRTRRQSGFLTLTIGKIIMKTNQKFALAVVTGVAASGSAFAAVPAAVTTALADAGTDAATVATAVLVVIVAIYAFKLLRRAL